METDILGTRLAILNNSIRSLGTAKEAEERNTMIITQLQTELDSKVKEIKENSIKISDLLGQHDQLFSQVNTLNGARIKANEEKDQFLKQSKEKVNLLEKVVKKVEIENREQKEEIDNLK